MKNENIKNSIIALLNAGSNIVTIEYQTDVKTSAKFKNVSIKKTSRANVMLFKNLKDYTDVYLNAVKRTASNIIENDANKVVDFEKSDNYFQHDKQCYSIVYHKTSGLPYLFAIFNKSLGSIYTIDGIESDKVKVAEYLTNSERDKLLNSNSLTYNVKNDIVHGVIVRTIKLDNIISIKANNAELTVNKALHG